MNCNARQVDQGRVEFIASTVGAEVVRACAYLGDSRLVGEFTELIEQCEPELTRVDLIWWSPDDESFVGSMYELSAHGVRNVLPGPGCKTGGYIADGLLPPERGWQLEIVAHVGNEAREICVQREPGMTERQLKAIAFRVLGARVLR